MNENTILKTELDEKADSSRVLRRSSLRISAKIAESLEASPSDNEATS